MLKVQTLSAPVSIQINRTYINRYIYSFTLYRCANVRRRWRVPCGWIESCARRVMADALAFTLCRVCQCFLSFSPTHPLRIISLVSPRVLCSLLSSYETSVTKFNHKNQPLLFCLHQYTHASVDLFSIWWESMTRCRQNTRHTRSILRFETR